MDADEALRPVGRGGEPRDRDRRRVGPDDCVGFEYRADTREDGALGILLLGRRFDDEIAIGEGFERLGRCDALERGLPLLFRDALATHLPCHVAVDGGDPGLDPVGGEIVELDVEPRERADVGDAAAHLPRANHADLANLKGRVAGTGLRPLFDLDHALSPALPSAYGHSPWHYCQRPILPSSAASSGSAWYRSATSP